MSQSSSSRILIGRYQPRELGLFIGGVLLVLLMLLAWVKPRQAPLATPSEARYARVSQDMHQRDLWMVPYFEGEARVKKPPLLHWTHRAMHAVLGEKDVLASRSVSMMGWSLTVLVVFWFGWRLRDKTTGLIAAIVFAMSIYTLIQMRMAIIDPIMAPFWAIATFTGFLMFHPARGKGRHWGGVADGTPSALSENAVRRYWYQTPGVMLKNDPAAWSWIWALVFWGAILVNFSFKGPQALMPFIPVLFYALLTHKRAVLKMWPFWWLMGAGLVLSALPLIAWGIAVVSNYPEAREVWYNETLGRMLGTADKKSTHGGRPLGYNWALLLACMMPALLFLPLPGIHFGSRVLRRVRRWRRLMGRKQWNDLPLSLLHTWRDGHVGLYLSLSVLVPMVFYSAFNMRAPNYLFMFTPMVAVGAALSFRSWLDIRDDFKVLKQGGVDIGRLGPNPLIALAIVVGLMAVTAVSIAITLGLDGGGYPPVAAISRWMGVYIVPALMLGACCVDWRRARRRAGVVLALGIIVLVLSGGTMHGLDVFRASMDKRVFLDAIQKDAEGRGYVLQSWGDTHTDLSYYEGSDVVQWPTPRKVEDLPALKPGELRYVLIRHDVPAELGADYDLSEHFEVIHDPSANWPDWLKAGMDYSILARQIGPIEGNQTKSE